MAQRIVLGQGAVPRMSERKTRYPRYPHALKFKPYCVVPTFIAPVIPGETLKSCRYSQRVVSDPIKDRLTGWWLENWVFYVKLSDIDEALPQQFLPTGALTPGDYQITASNTKYFTAASASYPAFNWINLCMDRIAAEFFHEEGESATLDGYHQAANSQRDWMENMIAQSDVTNPAPGSTIEDVDDQLTAFRQMMLDQMGNFTYDDYLRTYGVKTVNVERGIPELIDYNRTFTYPSNTIDPTDGSAASACSWAIENRMDRARFCKEPGFIVGCMTARPKVFRTGLKGSLVSKLWGPEMWMAPMFNTEAHHRIKELDGDEPITSGITALTTGASFYDLGDLFTHGEHFRNYDPTPSYAGPKDGDLRARFLTEAEIDALFVSTTGVEHIYVDGQAALSIASHLQDVT